MSLVLYLSPNRLLSSRRPFFLIDNQCHDDNTTAVRRGHGGYEDG
jgi:hypothetical protein